MERSILSGRFGFLAVVLALLATSAFAQSNALWSGSAQCKLTMQSDGYAHQEVQSWTIASGSQFTQQGGMQVYPATWTITGQGNAQRPQGPQVVATQWNSNVPGISAPIAVFIRASDNRLIIKSWHSQLTAPGAITGVRQLAGAQTNLTLTATEWSFPVIEDASTSTSVSGSGTMVVPGSLMPMQFASASGTANCSWQFSKGASGASGQAIPAAQLSSQVLASQIPVVVCPTPAGVSGQATISPSCGVQGQQNLSVSVTTTSPPVVPWDQGAMTAYIGGANSGVTMKSVSWYSPTGVTFVLNIDANATPGAESFYITQTFPFYDNRGNHGYSAQPFTVLPAPTITQVGGLSSANSSSSPAGNQITKAAVGSLNATQVQNSTPSNSVPANAGPVAGVQGSVAAGTPSSATPSTATATASASPNVSTTQAPSGGTTSSSSSGSRLLAPATAVRVTSMITQVSPATAAQGQTGLQVTLTGQNTHFVQGQTTMSFGTGISVTSPTVTSPTSASAYLGVDALSVPQTRTVQVTTGTEVATLANGFTVTQSSAPLINNLQQTQMLGSLTDQTSQLGGGQEMDAPTTDQFFSFVPRGQTCGPLFSTTCTDHAATVSIAGFPAGAQVKLTLYDQYGAFLSTTSGQDSSPTLSYSPPSPVWTFIEVQLLSPATQPRTYYTLRVQGN
jgi:hypothetical protein